MNIEVKYVSTRDKFMLFINNLFKQYVGGDMMSKANFIAKVLNTATALGQEFDQAPDTEAVYFDRGYNSGGSDPIIQDDLDAMGVTLADFISMITCLQQLNKFAQNQAVSQGDYSSTVNKLRERHIKLIASTGDFMDELYKEYGQLMIQLEILNSRIAEIKRKIAEGLNKNNKEKIENKIVKNNVGD